MPPMWYSWIRILISGLGVKPLNPTANSWGRQWLDGGGRGSPEAPYLADLLLKVYRGHFASYIPILILCRQCRCRIWVPRLGRVGSAGMAI